jgi:hypothetical protein
VGVPIGGDRSGVPDPPLVPAGYAFAIWGPIFLGCLLMGLAFCLPSWRRCVALRALFPWFPLAMLACTLWSIVASYADLAFGQGWWGLTIPNFLLIIAPLARALREWSRELARTGGLRASKAPLSWVLVGPTLGLYIGWCTAAIFANIAAWLASPPMSNLPRLGVREDVYSLALLVCAGLASHILLATLARSWHATARVAFILALVWALVAIAVKNFRGMPPLDQGLAQPIAFTALVIAASLIVATMLRRKKG